MSKKRKPKKYCDNIHNKLDLDINLITLTQTTSTAMSRHRHTANKRTDNNIITVLSSRKDIRNPPQKKGGNCIHRQQVDDTNVTYERTSGLLYTNKVPPPPTTTHRTTRQPCVSETQENTQTNTEYFQVNLLLHTFNIDYVVIIIYFSNSLSHSAYVLYGQHVTCVT